MATVNIWSSAPGRAASEGPKLNNQLATAKKALQKKKTGLVINVIVAWLPSANGRMAKVPGLQGLAIRETVLRLPSALPVRPIGLDLEAIRPVVLRLHIVFAVVIIRLESCWQSAVHGGPLKAVRRIAINKAEETCRHSGSRRLAHTQRLSCRCCSPSAGSCPHPAI